MWNKVFKYDNGKLYWLPRLDDSSESKMFNNRFANKEAGCVNSAGYRVIGYQGTRYRTHRIIWEMFKGPITDNKEVDHINCVTDDNRIENLQLVTPQYNKQRQGIIYGKGWSYINVPQPRPYRDHRTRKCFGTPCGAYMSYATALL